MKKITLTIIAILFLVGMGNAQDTLAFEIVGVKEIDKQVITQLGKAWESEMEASLLKKSGTCIGFKSVDGFRGSVPPVDDEIAKARLKLLKVEAGAKSKELIARKSSQTSAPTTPAPTPQRAVVESKKSSSDSKSLELSPSEIAGLNEYERSKLIELEYALVDLAVAYKQDSIKNKYNELYLADRKRQFENAKKEKAQEFEAQILAAKNGKKLASEVSKGTGVIPTVDYTWGTKEVMSENDLFKRDSILQAGVYDVKEGEIEIELTNQSVVKSNAEVVIASNNTQIMRQASEQSGERVEISENEIESARNQNVIAVVTSEKVLETSGGKIAIHKEGKRLKMEARKAIQKERQERKALKHERRKNKRLGNQEVKKAKNMNKDGIYMVDGVQLTSPQPQPVQPTPSCDTGQTYPTCNPNQTYQYSSYPDNRTPIEKRYGLSGLGGGGVPPTVSTPGVVVRRR